MSGTKSFPADNVKLHISSAADAPVGSMTVLMKTNKYYTDGNLLQTGVQYTVTKEWGQDALTRNWCEDVADVFPETETPSGLTASQVAYVQEQVAGGGSPRILHIAANLVRTADGTTADADDVTMTTFTIPGGLLKNNGALIFMTNMTGVAASQDKNLTIWIGGQTIASPPIVAANTRAGHICTASMAGASGTIESPNLGLNAFGQATGAVISRSVDMTVDQTAYLSLKWAAAVTAGNTWQIMHVIVLAIPGTE